MATLAPTPGVERQREPESVQVATIRELVDFLLAEVDRRVDERMDAMAADLSTAIHTVHAAGFGNGTTKAA